MLTLCSSENPSIMPQTMPTLQPHPYLRFHSNILGAYITHVQLLTNELGIILHTVYHTMPGILRVNNLVKGFGHILYMYFLDLYRLELVFFSWYQNVEANIQGRLLNEGALILCCYCIAPNFAGDSFTYFTGCGLEPEIGISLNYSSSTRYTHYTNFADNSKIINLIK